MRISNEKFYDHFHKKNKPISKVITSNNFTYYPIIKVINKHLPESLNLKVLDFGCGTGTLSFYLAKSGLNVIGVDISPEAIQTARKSNELLKFHNLSFMTLADFNRENAKTTDFDLIISIEVLEHLSHDESAVKMFYKRLKRNGIVICSAPSLNSPIYRLGLAKKFDDEVGHLRRYSIQSFKYLFTSCGFKLIELSRSEGIFRNSLYLNSFLGKIIRYIRGPLVFIFHKLDNLSLSLFGESNLIVVLTKP
jgi:SAM-dependent methyltransferase